MKYKEIQEFLNGLTEDQLQQEAKVYPEEEATRDVIEMEITQQDQYYDPDYPEEGCSPLELYEDKDGLVLGIPKGTVMINVR